MIKTEDLPVIFSFPRSGTHWLCSLIHQWFYFGLLHTAPMNNAGPLSFESPAGSGICPWTGLFGGHWYDPDAPRAAELRACRRVVYLVRNIREVMVSSWRLRCVMMRHNKKTRMPTLGQHLDTLVSFGPWDEKTNPVPDGLSVYEMCEWSQNKWLEAGGFVVRYEELVTNLGAVRDRLAEFLGREAEPLRYPSKQRVGYVVPQGDKTNDELWEMVT